jgi:hypothetical protein
MKDPDSRQPVPHDSRDLVSEHVTVSPAQLGERIPVAGPRKETQAMPQTSDTALLILDFQVGIGDRP